MYRSVYASIMHISAYAKYTQTHIYVCMRVCCVRSYTYGETDKNTVRQEEAQTQIDILLAKF